jgi:hypothetical protein
MRSNELISVSTMTWKRGIGSFVLCGGTHTSDGNGKYWDGKWLAICLPWFQVRFERHWPTSIRN